MKVKFSERSIEVTKTFAVKASHFGSEEYNLLRTAMQDLPDFKLVIKAAPKRRQPYTKGLTYEYMYSYISDVNKDDSLMKEYMKLREYGCNYGQIRKWFLTRFPEFNNFAA
ncbi:MAG: hypothetical protein IJE81_03635 [Oscillospiraceae bacterium]|nr:hypothetical protein [Oscillospiraceae bacterium]